MLASFFIKGDIFMKIITVLKTFTLFSLFSMNTLFGLEQSDKDAIHSVIQGYTDSWNQRECQGFGEGFTDDSDWVNIFAMHFVGKHEIEERHIKILQTFLKNSTLEITDISLREVQPGVVVAIVKWNCHNFRDPFDPSKPATTREGIFSHAFIQKDNKWLITLTQNTLKPQAK